MIKARFLFLLLLFLLAAPVAISATNINACQTIAASGTYDLTQNVTSNSCFTITESNVDLNCHGFSIIGTQDSGSYGVDFDINQAGVNPYELQNLTVRNCIIRNFGSGVILGSVQNATVKDTILYSNDQAGVSSTESIYLNISNLTIINSSYGILDQYSGNLGSYKVNNSFQNNVIYNATYGVYQYNTDGSSTSVEWVNFTNNTIYNTSSEAFYIYGMGNATLYNNTAYLSKAGFHVELNADNGTLFNNTAHSNREDGFFVSAGMNLVNNTSWNNSRNGFFLTGLSNSVNLTYNIAYNNSYSGFNLSLSSANFTNNSAYNNSIAGFFLNGSTANFTNNNATSNWLIQYKFSNYQLTPSRGNFTGLNYAFNTSRNGFDINTTGGSNATTLASGVYNPFITSYGQIFFDNANNVSIKVMNLSDSGAATSGCGNSQAGSCDLITNNSNVVNVTKTETNGRINLGMYFNTSNSTNSSGINVSRYTAGWVNAGQTAIDTHAGTVRYDGITSFSTFAVVNFYSGDGSSGNNGNNGGSNGGSTPTTTTTPRSGSQEDNSPAPAVTPPVTQPPERVVREIQETSDFYLVEGGSSRLLESTLTNIYGSYAIRPRVNGTSCTECSVLVEMPDGSELNLTEEPAGQFNFTITSPGSYTLRLFDSKHRQITAKKIEVKAPVQPTPAQRPQEVYWIILLLIIATIIGTYYWYRSKRTVR